jgi:hypothetical protein
LLFAAAASQAAQLTKILFAVAASQAGQLTKIFIRGGGLPGRAIDENFYSRWGAAGTGFLGRLFIRRG